MAKVSSMTKEETVRKLKELTLILTPEETVALKIILALAVTKSCAKNSPAVQAEKRLELREEETPKG